MAAAGATRSLWLQHGPCCSSSSSAVTACSSAGPTRPRGRTAACWTRTQGSPPPSHWEGGRLSGSHSVVLRVVCKGKGGGGGGKGKDKSKGKGPKPLVPKQGESSSSSSSPSSAPSSAPPYTRPEIILHSLDLIDSYFRIVGSPMFGPDARVEVAEAAKALWEAPFIVISHGTEDDPIYNYANAMALQVFETEWDSFTRMPSRKYCKEEEQEDRNKLLQAAHEGPKNLKGLVRLTLKGREVGFDEGLLWDVVASDGENYGQAAVIRQWHYLDEEGNNKVEGDAVAPATPASIDGAATISAPALSAPAAAPAAAPVADASSSPSPEQTASA